MKLLNSFGPNPRLVRMFMAEKGITLPSEDLDLLGGANRQAPYLSKNPAGQTPALELDDWAYRRPLDEFVSENRWERA